jgi:hypothetical protein
MQLPRIHRIGRLANLMRELGPYAAIEILVPGGSLIALFFWAMRQRSWFTGHACRTLALVVAGVAGLMLPG